MTIPFSSVAIVWLTTFAFLVADFSVCSAIAAEPPTCVDDTLSVELVASEPEVVTPISCRFDSRGRLFVIESHTHFPPNDYQGPKHDLVKIFDDPDGDGRLDRIRVFHQGTSKTMSMAIGRDDSIYLATRSTIIRIRDTDGDDVADETETLITLETKADYPHNGLGGLLVEEPEGQVASITFGMGENFGEPYTLLGSDGSKQMGKGEGGNIFQCSLSGGDLQRIATGFWNPFGICRDAAGRLLMVDNDADAMPPSRIVHVLPQADYGFEFRFGRAGTHPLQAWNGELPGTLPMTAGTGEAPCSILNYRGQYWVTSWGDNRIERYTPTHDGISIKATRDTAVLGNAMFRPVDMAIAPNGSMYVTDWVDRSYNVHQKGRIWRIRFSTPAIDSAAAQLSDEARTLKSKLESATENALKSLIQDSPDSHLTHLASVEAGNRDLLNSDAMANEERPRVRLASLMNQRWRRIAGLANMPDDNQQQTIIEAALQDADESVRLAAVRWAAETGNKSFLPSIKQQLERPELSPQMLAGTAAAISYLQLGKIEAGGFDALTRQTLIGIAIDASRPNHLRRMAMGLVPPDSPQWLVEQFVSAARSNDSLLAQTAIRHLAVAATKNDAARNAVRAMTQDQSLEEALRADLSIIDQSSPVKDDASPRPPIDDLDGWLKLVGQGGNAERGWRVFFGASRGKCANCHARDGRGASVGPDLTALPTNGTDRKRLLESILHPSREVGPMYTTWQVLTTDGRTIAGLKLNGGGVGQSARYLLADASTVDVPMEAIEDQIASPTSIMPQGIEQLMTIEDMRDLLAFLTSPPESQTTKLD